MNKILYLSISIVLIFAMCDQGIAQNRGAVVTPAFTDEEKAIDLLFAAWNSRNADQFVALFSDDAVYEDVAAGHVARGKNEVRKWAAGAFTYIADFKLEVKKRSIYEGGGVVEWVWSGTDKGLFKTGKSFSVRGASVIQVRGGKISNYKEYYDFATVMRQLGLLPADKAV